MVAHALIPGNRGRMIATSLRPSGLNNESASVSEKDPTSSNNIVDATLK